LFLRDSPGGPNKAFSHTWIPSWPEGTGTAFEHGLECFSNLARNFELPSEKLPKAGPFPFETFLDARESLRTPSYSSLSLPIRKLFILPWSHGDHLWGKYPRKSKVFKELYATVWHKSKFFSMKGVNAGEARRWMFRFAIRCPARINVRNSYTHNLLFYNYKYVNQ
jgi:hypothetical protein